MKLKNERIISIEILPEDLIKMHKGEEFKFNIDKDVLSEYDDDFLIKVYIDKNKINEKFINENR